MVRVEWRTPVFGKRDVLCIVGHLHNTVAKHRNSPNYKAYFGKLASLCAGGGRIVGMDLNMAVFAAIGEMRSRGVGLALLSNHHELNDPDWQRPHILKYDTLGIWIVGNIGIE